VTHVGGSAIATVRSSVVAAVCGPFDACVLAALGVSSAGNPSGIDVEGAGEAFVHGDVTADLTQGDACRDQTGLRQADIQLRRRADRLEISVSPAISHADDPLRTRCPGPELGSHQLTSASVPLSALRHPSFTVAVHGGSFSDGPYRVTTRSTLTLTLRRTGIKTQIVPY
jgi:hypothetical protein